MQLYNLQFEALTIELQNKKKKYMFINFDQWQSIFVFLFCLSLNNCLFLGKPNRLTQDEEQDKDYLLKKFRQSCTWQAFVLNRDDYDWKYDYLICMFAFFLLIFLVVSIIWNTYLYYIILLQDKIHVGNILLPLWINVIFAHPYISYSINCS